MRIRDGNRYGTGSDRATLGIGTCDHMIDAQVALSLPVPYRRSRYFPAHAIAN